jgi:hypothetical protein
MIGSRGQNSPQTYKICLKTVRRAKRTPKIEVNIQLLTMVSFMVGSRDQNSPQTYKICFKTTQKVGYISLNKETTVINSDTSRIFVIISLGITILTSFKLH